MALRVDVHQHLWTEPLLAALGAREELPFARRESGLTVLFLADERPYAIAPAAEAAPMRRALVADDGLDRALVCLSSPLGIESLPRAQATPLLDAYHDGAFALGPPFGVWGAVALDAPDPADVDRLLSRGCVGISLPAGALAGTAELAHVRPLLRRIEGAEVPLLIHPGPGLRRAGSLQRAGVAPALDEPLWWPALTRYVAQINAAWMTFVAAARAEHPRLRAIFTMLAGLAPLQAERLRSRGGPDGRARDRLIFYETSSYGRDSVRRLADVVGSEQILYGSDRPVVDPGEHSLNDGLDWDTIAGAADRAFGDRLRTQPVSGTVAAAASPSRAEEALVR
jgi:hypothetical protein